MSTCDFLIKSGHVIDPANGINEICDIAVTGGKITSVGKQLACASKKIISAENYFVVPGLIDMHCHCCPTFPFDTDTLPNIHPDAHMAQNGVTTAVDAGTCGVDDFPFFKKHVIDKSEVRVLAFLNIADGGMVHMDTEQCPSRFNASAAAKMAKENKDCVVGIKTAHYHVGKPFDAEHEPWASVDAALDAAQMCSLPCMVDMQPNLPLRTYEGLLERMRSGDIHTHMYAQQFHIFDDNGKIKQFLSDAKKRGVKFDLGHGAGSFWFRNAIPALEQSYEPDTISTDLYLDNVVNPVIGLLHVMSKFMCMGMPLFDIILKTTAEPAKIIGHTELGTLSVGACADIALLRRAELPVRFADSGRAAIDGDARLECVMTMREGKILYNPYALTLPHWKDAPIEYYTAPGVIIDSI